MRSFTCLGAVAAGLPEANIDTDRILPGRFLKTVSRAGLGRGLFHGLRFDDAGDERPGFVLNREPWRRAGILIGLDNLGCGSSREHAAWALADFGIRAVLAPSFAEIFRNNCIKNGILPIELSRAVIDRLIILAAVPATARMAIDLPVQALVLHDGEAIPFLIRPEHKAQLLSGLDEIAASERLIDGIAAFESGAAYCCPPIPIGHPVFAAEQPGPERAEHA